MNSKTTARQIIEKRLGRKWTSVGELSPDQKTAIKLLAMQIVRQQASRKMENNHD